MIASLNIAPEPSEAAASRRRDESEQVLAVGLKPFEYAKHLLGWLTISAVRHQFGVAQDGIERRAQLMAHIGQELRLVLARLFELSALVLDFVEKPDVLDSDRRLVGECGSQLDLLVGEWPHIRPCQSQNANCEAFPQHGNAK